MARGNGRQLLFHQQDDYQRMLDGLVKTAAAIDEEIIKTENRV